MNTVKELIEALSKFPEDMPIRISANGEARDGEYYSPGRVSASHLGEQNTDGDPDEYWNDPLDIEFEEDRLHEGDTHFKYQGVVVLIS